VPSRLENGIRLRLSLSSLGSSCRAMRMALFLPGAEVACMIDPCNTPHAEFRDGRGGDYWLSRRDRLGQELLGRKTRCPSRQFQPGSLFAPGQGERAIEASFRFRLPMLPMANTLVMARLLNGDATRDTTNTSRVDWLHDANLMGIKCLLFLARSLGGLRWRAFRRNF